MAVVKFFIMHDVVFASEMDECNFNANAVSDQYRWRKLRH